MPMKKGAGGKLQRYDSKGRYCKTDYALILSNNSKSTNYNLTKKEKRDIKITQLDNIAENSNDPYLLETYKLIKQNFHDIIKYINDIEYDTINNKKREFDIRTKHNIIEIKSGYRIKKSKQIFEQKAYADSIKCHYILYDPNIYYRSYEFYVNHGITVCATKEELINKLKETEK